MSLHPNLNFKNLDHIREIYERTTGMSVHERHPYGGDLVFTAFSGSHQDAIKKGMDLREKEGDSDQTLWQVPYLSIDPRDIGRNYEEIIRINSQSGKGGVAFILSREFGLDLPKAMHPEVGILINAKADSESRELPAEDIHSIFKAEYLQKNHPLELISYADSFSKIKINGVKRIYLVKETVLQALEKEGLKDFKLTDYRQHSTLNLLLMSNSKQKWDVMDVESIQASKKVVYSHW